MYYVKVSLVNMHRYVSHLLITTISYYIPKSLQKNENATRRDRGGETAKEFAPASPCQKPFDAYIYYQFSMAPDKYSTLRHNLQSAYCACPLTFLSPTKCFLYWCNKIHALQVIALKWFLKEGTFAYISNGPWTNMKMLQTVKGKRGGGKKISKVLVISSKTRSVSSFSF